MAPKRRCGHTGLLGGWRGGRCASSRMSEGGGEGIRPEVDGAVAHLPFTPGETGAVAAFQAKE